MTQISDTLTYLAPDREEGRRRGGEKKGARKMSEGEINVTIRVIIDCFLLIISPIPSLVFILAVEPYRRGFFCDDESISHPYIADTIPLWVVIVVGMIVPIMAMVPVEVMRYRRHASRDLPRSDHEHRYRMCGKSVHPYLVSVYKVVGPFLFAIAVCQVSTDIIKYAVGRLRPHYLTVCQPDWGSFDCKDAQGNYIYIDGDVCTGTEHVKEARLSHPSGHSSQSMMCAVYLVMRLRWGGSRLLRHFIQAVVLYGAVYVCVSRISDYKHHWSDVLAGGVLGVLVAVLVAYYVSDLFPRPGTKLVQNHFTDMKQITELPNKTANNYPTNELKTEEIEDETARAKAIWM